MAWDRFGNTHGKGFGTRSRRSLGAVALLVAVATAAAAAASGATPDPPSIESRMPGDAAHGKTLYQACAACHSLDENDIGPRHRGVVGRHAGRVEDYSYSAALKASDLIWTEAALDRWLANPSALVPGTKMFFKIDDAQSRADIIAYLKEQK